MCGRPSIPWHLLLRRPRPRHLRPPRLVRLVPGPRSARSRSLRAHERMHQRTQPSKHTRTGRANKCDIIVWFTMRAAEQVRENKYKKVAEARAARRGSRSAQPGVTVGRGQRARGDWFESQSPAGPEWAGTAPPVPSQQRADRRRRRRSRSPSKQNCAHAGTQARTSVRRDALLTQHRTEHLCLLVPTRKQLAASHEQARAREAAEVLVRAAVDHAPHSRPVDGAAAHAAGLRARVHHGRRELRRCQRARGVAHEAQLGVGRRVLVGGHAVACHEPAKRAARGGERHRDRGRPAGCRDD